MRPEARMWYLAKSGDSCIIYNEAKEQEEQQLQKKNKYKLVLSCKKHPKFRASLYASMPPLLL
jgi:hypothetical protein